MKLLPRSILIGLAIFLIASHALAQDSVWVSYFGSGMKAYEQGNYKEAERFFRAAIDEAKKAADAKHPRAVGMMSDSLSGLAATLGGQKRYADAENVIREQLQLLELATREGDPDYSKTLNNLGLMLSEQGKYKEAEEIHRKALILREKYDDPPHRNLAVSLINLGKVYYEQGKTSESEALFNQARGILSKIRPDDVTPDDLENVLACDHNLALVYVEQKKYADAELRYKAVILLTEKVKGVNHPDLILYLENYAKLLRLTNRPKKAAKLDLRIRSIKDHMR